MNALSSHERMQQMARLLARAAARAAGKAATRNTAKHKDLSEDEDGAMVSPDENLMTDTRANRVVDNNAPARGVWRTVS